MKNDGLPCDATAAPLPDLYDFHSLREPAIREAIDHFNLPATSLGLDAGCGVGRQSLMLARQLGKRAKIIGLDLAKEAIASAEDFALRESLSQQVSFMPGDMNQLPFEDNHFDWAWSLDTFWPCQPEEGCASDNPLQLLSELKRVVKPGGQIIIGFWSGQKLLPGYPLLEARLLATSGAQFPYKADTDPKLHFMNALSWFEHAGFSALHAKTFTADLVAPLSSTQKEAVAKALSMFFHSSQEEISPDDLKQFQRLSSRQSTQFIADHPFYYGFIHYTFFQGKVEK
ncbi:class I SAM-dependent methyltransferase [Thiomicrorhabdus sp.]|uniref:class I SAM-dependent methyltransferase n=1 Tax=Thiomicrorhabdus sp. TaxID=2039724 RepID=UPI0029C74F46|nr:class I SAM-dependent methyltransferase [Thiomicrorhabdus sp.]